MGSILNIQNSFSILINESTFNENIASEGGVIYSLNLNNLIINNSKFENNQAISSGGVIFGNNI